MNPPVAIQFRPHGVRSHGFEPRSREDHVIAASERVLVEAKTLPDLTPEAVAIDSMPHVLTRDGDAQAWCLLAVGSGKDHETRKGGATPFGKDLLELFRPEEALRSREAPLLGVLARIDLHRT